MKTFYSLLFILLFITCSSNNNFDKVKIGMKSSEVVSLIGSPKEKMPMFVYEMWIYNDAQNHIVTIGNDTVMNILTQAEFKKTMENIEGEMDSISTTLEN